MHKKLPSQGVLDVNCFEISSRYEDDTSSAQIKLCVLDFVYTPANIMILISLVESIVLILSASIAMAHGVADGGNHHLRHETHSRNHSLVAEPIFKPMNIHDY